MSKDEQKKDNHIKNSSEKEVSVKKILTLQDLKEKRSEIKTHTPPQASRKKFNRTPSGNILTNQVQSVRVFFSPTDSTKCVKEKKSLLTVKQTVHHANSRSHDQPLNQVLLGALNNCVEGAQPYPTKQTACVNYHDQTDQSVKQTGKKRKLRNSDDSNTEEKSGKSAKEDLTLAMKNQNKQSEEMETEDQLHQEYLSAAADNSSINQEDFLKKYSLDGTAQAIDVRTVLAMFQKLEESKAQASKESVVAEVNEAMKEYEHRIQHLEEELKNVSRKAKLTEDILQYNRQVMNDITKRLDSLELANARRAAILTGYRFSSKKGDRMRQISDFLYKELEVYARIEDSYLLGGKEDSPVVIIFQTLDDKNNVFEKKSQLKEMSKERDVPVFLNHYLTAAENEKRRREQTIKADIKKSEEEKPEIDYGKGGIKIANETYTKKIIAPDPTDLLKFTVQELDEVMKKKTLKGNPIRSDGNLFIPYAVDTNDFNTIRDCYFKLRLIHASARHIVCIFNLPGPDAQKHLNADYCDDGDIGVGAAILREMKASNIYNRAFFVVRYCGEKLNENRIGLYLRAVKELMKQKPYNEILQKKQSFNEQQQTTKKTGYQYKPKPSSPRKSTRQNDNRR